MIKTNEELAKEEYERRLIANDKAGLLGQRGVFPMYHRLFYQYLRWVLAELSPYASPLPLHWSQGEDYVRHVSYFGKPWGVHNVDRHLTELLGKQYTRIFSRESTAEDYQYMAEIIVETKLGPEHIPVTMTMASAWLTNRIAQQNEVTAEAVVPTAESLMLITQLSQTEVAPYSPWAPLLMGRLSLPAFYAFLRECGLLTTDGNLTPLGRGDGIGKARIAPWVGPLRALIEAKLLNPNIAAVCRALEDPAGELRVELSPNSLLNPSAKAMTYQEAAEVVLRTSSLLQN